MDTHAGQTDPAIITAHRSCIYHRAQIEQSAVCGCFFCGAIFPSVLVGIWVDEDQTALCPECGIDAVIGAASGFPITAAFLRRMAAHWFGTEVARIFRSGTPR